MKVVGQSGGFVRCVPERPEDEGVTSGDLLWSEELGEFEILLSERFRDGSYLLGVMRPKDDRQEFIDRLLAEELREWPVLPQLPATNGGESWV